MLLNKHTVAQVIAIAIMGCFAMMSSAWANLSVDAVLSKTRSELSQTNATAQPPLYPENSATHQAIKDHNATQQPPLTSPQADTLIGRLAQSGYALMFFFDSTCPHCQNFAPAVKSVSDTYGLHVFDFSFDNKGVSSFPMPAIVTDKIYRAYYGTARPFYPVLILQNVNTMNFYVIAQGEIPEASLIQSLNKYAKELL